MTEKKKNNNEIKKYLMNATSRIDLFSKNFDTILDEKQLDENKKEEMDKDEKEESETSKGKKNKIMPSKYEIKVENHVVLIIIYFMNILIKANLVQMAYNMKVLGIIWGPITIFLIAVMSLISLNLILEVGESEGIKDNYLLIVEKKLGHWGSIIILLLQLIGCFGGSLSYVIVFIKVIPSLLNLNFADANVSEEIFFSIVFGLIVLFFIFGSDSNSLKTADKFAALSILLFIFITILDFISALFSEDRLININKKWSKDKKDEILNGLNRSKYPFFEERLFNIISAVSCIILSFSFHGFTFSIYQAMGQNVTRKKFFITSVVSVFLTSTIYITCGVIGYLLYYDTLEDSILDAINVNWLASLLSLTNVINVMMSFPMSFNGTTSFFNLFLRIIITLFRDYILPIFSICSEKVKNYKKAISGRSITKVFRDKEDSKNIMFDKNKSLVQIENVYLNRFITILILISIIIFGNKYNELKIIFALLGGVMSNCISFIFPAIFYLLQAKKSTINIIISYFFIIFGLITMLICLFSVFKNILF